MIKKIVIRVFRQLCENLQQNLQEINGIKVIRYVCNESSDVMKTIIATLKNKFANDKFMFVGGTVCDGKPTLTILLSQPMVAAGFHAGNMVREAAKLIQGGGGGQPFMASAGGKNPDGIGNAVDSVVEKLK